MKFELNNLPEYSKDTIANDIKRVNQLLKKEKLTKKDYLSHGKVGSGNTINKYFGSWHNALVYSGLEYKSNNRIPTQKLINQTSKNMSDDEIIRELMKVAKNLKTNSLTMDQLNASSKIISGSTVAKRFGWEKGLELAELSIDPHGKKYSNTECFENLLNVWTKLGRQPKGLDMNDENLSKVGLKAYTHRYGTWIKALNAFVDEINDPNESNDIIQNPISSISVKKIKRKIKDEDKRDIKLSLRFKVLSRDNFKCVLCGNSPATDETCILHVDHIIPYSKNGKTIEKNLRSLCKTCNLGRGNRYID